MRCLCTSSSVKEGSVLRRAGSPLFGPMRLPGPRGAFRRWRRSGPKNIRVRMKSRTL